MSTYNSIAWLPLCAALTGIGLVISYFAMRRRGLGSGLRGAAWSLLPLAAYLTGSIQMFWKIGTAIGDFAAHLVLSPKVWSGVGVAALAGVLFVVSAPLKRRRKRLRKAGAEPPDETGTAAGTAAGITDGTAAQRPAVPATADGSKPGRSARRDKGRELEPSRSRAAKAASDPGDDDMREVEEILRRRGIS
jgi:cytochrome c oxidase assembly factor CtaG